MDPEELRITLLKGVEAILDKAFDKFLSVVLIELAETEQEQLLTVSNKAKVSDELSVITDVESNGIKASTRVLLENYSTRGLLEDDSYKASVEQTQNKDLTSEVCGNWAKSLLEPSPIQGIWLDSLMVMKGWIRVKIMCSM
ncbi:hypothetical protein V6N12_042533 [Hibiscus sabdariffa]|uniref:Uncharacterized protein n=1 Tax=Hibiscus sabdariffa TaxID=183260 RepID=A0ABR2EF25_9ROSI